jgi:hypothetical protein
MERKRANEIGEGWICFVGTERAPFFGKYGGERESGKLFSKVEWQTKFENWREHERIWIRKKEVAKWSYWIGAMSHQAERRAGTNCDLPFGNNFSATLEKYHNVLTGYITNQDHPIKNQK